MSRLFSVFFLCAVFCGYTHGATFLKVNILEDGSIRGGVSIVYDARVSEINSSKGEFPLDYQFPDTPTRYWKFDGTNVTEMTAEEKYQVDHGHKSTEQKAYESQFFQLTEELLTLTEDERAGQDPPIKLGFPDIQILIEAVQAVDPMGAVNFSLKLLTIDAALKRYDMMWWDNAVEHTLE